MKAFSKYQWMQALLLLCLLVFWFFLLKPSGIYSRQTFEQVEERLVGELNPDLYPRQDTVKVYRYFSVDPDEFVQSSFFRQDDAMSGSELWLVQFDTNQQKEAFLQAALNRSKSQQNLYAGYAPDQEAILAASIIDVQENYGLYVAGENAAQIDEAFLAALKGEQ